MPHYRIRNKEDWWNLVIDNWMLFVQILRQFTNKSNVRSAQSACNRKDHRTLISIFDECMFKAPNSRRLHRDIPGYNLMHELVANDWVFLKEENQ